MTDKSEAPALEVKGLSKHYGKKRVLNDLNMNVPCGSVYGFLGVNGAGKTTTFGILSGFLPREEGEISIRGRLSILPQDALFYSDRSLLSQLKFFGLLSGIPGARAKEEALRVLELVGLGSEARTKAEHLSHGMSKKLAIAQALLGDPDIILLDEPTSGLDPKNIIDIRQLILSLAQKKTLVISSHILSEIAEMCDTVGILHEGKMKFEGPIHQITGSSSSVTYTLSGIGQPEGLDGLSGITSMDFAEAEGRLMITYNPELCRIEELNRRIMELVSRQGGGIREILLGVGLEKGFLSLLK